MGNKIKNAISNAESINPMEHPNAPLEDEQDQLGGFSIEEMNKEWALVLLGSKAVMVHEQPYAQEIEDRLQIRTVDAFNRWYDNKFVFWKAADGRMKPMTWSKVWMHSSDRRQYRGLEFFPCSDGVQGSPGYLNLWQGYEIKPRKKKDAYAVFDDHLLTNVCGGDEALRDWVFGWFAHLMQRPRERTGTALVFRGRMGAGKSTVGEVMGSLIASHFYQVDDPRYITGNFNAHMAKCLLLQAEEAVWAGDKNAEGRLKGLITSKYQMIEAKGVDPIRLRNYVRLVMTSNEDWVVPAGKDERRFCVLDVGDGAAQNHGYFRELHAELDNGGREALLYDLLHFDLDSIDLWTIPKTDALLEQKIRSLDSIEAWWYSHLQNGETYTASGSWETVVPCAALYDDYIKLSDRVGIKRRSWESEIGKTLKRLVPGLEKKRTTPPSGDEYGARRWCYLMPSLEQCRDGFSQAVGQSIDWQREASNEMGF
jgi:hypothetical protein